MLHRSIRKQAKKDMVQTIKTAQSFIALITFDLGSTGHNFQQANQILFDDDDDDDKLFITLLPSKTWT